MKISFLTIYDNHADSERVKSDAQYDLLGMWQKSILLQNISFINSAKVEFTDYGLFDYPNQERAKKEVSRACGYQAKKNAPIEYWYGNERYEELEELYKALAEQKRLMELTITVEEK